MAGRILRESLAHRVKELYSAEQQQARLLPRLVSAASSKSLQRVLALHLRETTQQAARLERVFTLLHEPIRWARCAGVLGILEECDEAMEEHQQGALRDAAIIATAQRLDYYEMAAYGAAAAWAEALGLKRVAKLLNQSLDEEVAVADELLAVGADSRPLEGGEGAGAVAWIRGRSNRRSRTARSPRCPGRPSSRHRIPGDPGRRDIGRDPGLDAPASEPAGAGALGTASDRRTAASASVSARRTQATRRRDGRVRWYGTSPDGDGGQPGAADRADAGRHRRCLGGLPPHRRGPAGRDARAAGEGRARSR